MKLPKLQYTINKLVFQYDVIIDTFRTTLTAAIIVLKLAYLALLVML